MSFSLFLNNPKIYNRFLIFLLIVLTFLTFSPALQNDFVNYDDAKYIANNPAIKSLSWSHIQKMFSTVKIGIYHYHPITLLTWTIEYHFVKLTPYLYILNNILLHISNILLIFWLTLQLCKKKEIAFLSALFFSIHPLRVESVVWITERKDVLYAFFYLLGLNVYTKWIQHNKKNSVLFITTHFLFIFSCLSKPMAISFPIALLSLDFLIKGKIHLKDFYEKIIFFGFSSIFGIISMNQNPSLSNGVYQIYNFTDRLILSINAFWFYLSKIFIPVNLSCYYPMPVKTNNHLPATFYVIASVTLCISPFILIFLKNQHRIIQWGILFFISTIFFVIGLISFSSCFIADRYTYIPAIGISIIFAWGIHQLIEKSSGYLKKIFPCFMVIICASLMILTIKQTTVWHDGVSLWSHVIKQFPNTTMAYSNRGNAYWKQENYTAALIDYNYAIALNPQDTATISNRGATYLRLGRADLALMDFNRAIKLNPLESQSFNNRGSLFFETGNYQLAIQDFTRSLELKPIQIPALVNRANAYKQMGKHQKAQEDLNRALQINPDFQKYKPQF